MKYNTKHIKKLTQIEHLRQNTGMYIGSSENANRLLIELLDNSLDEVQSGYCNIIGVFIDTKEKIYSILDNGRGIPFNEKLPLEKDPPVLISTELYTSGKFEKSSSDTAYKLSIGLHGIGIVSCFALSKWMSIDIYRDNKKASYYFNCDKNKITRNVEKFKDKKPYSTKISISPDKKYFNNIDVDLNEIEERLRIACINYPDLKVVFRIDGGDKIIINDEKRLLYDYLSKNEDLNWIEFFDKKEIESYKLKIAWDEQGPAATKLFSCVNLVRVDSGCHITTLNNMLKNVFSQFAKKYKYNFKPEDCLSFLRLYFDLKIIKTSFEAQVKVKLEFKSGIEIMNSLENKIKKYFENNDDFRTELLERFQAYRTGLQSKKLIKRKGKKRITTKLTKLLDCAKVGGELLIGEGDSACGGLIEVRNYKKHAILPLRGVTANILTKTNALEVQEIKEIINAIGTGIEDHCDISKLRYSKIILAADSDPAGGFITVLLIIIFAKLTPDIIKKGKLYICQTPLFATRSKNGKLIPLWTQEEIDKIRQSNGILNRYKGLGEFCPEDLKVFTLDESTRKLIQVKWSSNYKKLFKLLSSSSERRKLVLNKWSLE